MLPILVIIVFFVCTSAMDCFFAQTMDGFKKENRGAQKQIGKDYQTKTFPQTNVFSEKKNFPNPYEISNLTLPKSKIDDFVLSKLKEKGIKASPLCSDPIFLRRVYLDLTGTIPTAFEAREFLLDRSPDKRSRLIDKLLESEEYVDYFTMKWCDVLRVKAEFPINLWPNAVQAYHRWIHDCVKTNLPYDEFVRQMLIANGSNFRVPQVNFYRAVQSKTPEGIAQCVALTFMGIRPEKLTKEQIDGMAVFFSKIGYKSTTEWKEEIVFFDPFKITTQGIATVSYKPTFPDGIVAKIPQDMDPRIVFANWLTSPKNPWFAKAAVNRFWYWVYGRGIIHEPDDIRPDNPPSNPELLTYLEQEFVSHKYDIKHLLRLILNSQTYQRSSIPADENQDASKYFAFYPIRRLGAEVLIDAINKVTSTTEKYRSEIPEPFSFIPDEIRAVCLADGSVTSPFLELFGRPPRDTGLESERNNKFTPSQRLHLLNSSHILRKIDQSKMIQFQMQGGKSTREIVSNLYLGILSRFPTEKEIQTAENYFQTSGLKPRECAIDLVWALLNSVEFLYHH